MIIIIYAIKLFFETQYYGNCWIKPNANEEVIQNERRKKNELKLSNQIVQFYYYHSRSKQKNSTKEKHLNIRRSCCCRCCCCFFFFIDNKCSYFSCVFGVQLQLREKNIYLYTNSDCVQWIHTIFNILFTTIQRHALCSLRYGASISNYGT